MTGTARRSVALFSAGMVALIAVAWGGSSIWQSPAMIFGAPPGMQLPAKQLQGFLEFLRVDAAIQGITPQTFDAAFAGMSVDSEVLELATVQPEYIKTAGEYLAIMVSDARLGTGQQKLSTEASTLAAVEAAYGVDRHVVLAIWGIESNFGVGMGNRSVLRSLSTLAAFETRRPEFWRNELLAALRMLQSGEAKGGDLVGSWAGAMGHTQFMPSTYVKHAVDFNGDGRRDIWNTVPDALGSTANYLKAWGWVQAAPWGFEVRLPKDFDYGLSNPGTTRTWAEWQVSGLALAKGRNTQVSGTLGGLELLLPAGANGPAFLVGDNFRAILKYNNAVSYALAVGHLADRLAAGPAIEKRWPPGDRALAKAERDEIQRRLTALGFDTGGIDGIIGQGTKAAIRLFQKTRALPPDGHADLALVERLRQEGSR